MALSDIIKKISDDGELEVQKIKDQSDSEITTIQRECELYVAERSKLAEDDRSRRISKTTERIIAKARHHIQFLIGQKEQLALEAVFEAIERKLLAIDKTTYLNWLTRLYSRLPAPTEGTFLVANQRSAETVELLTTLGVDPKAISIETENVLMGGFIFLNQDREVNFSFVSLLRIIKERETAKIAGQLSK